MIKMIWSLVTGDYKGHKIYYEKPLWDRSLIMSSPFPGMDSYLEQSVFWSSFHSQLIVALADFIELQLSSQYYIEVETRTLSSPISVGNGMQFHLTLAERHDLTGQIYRQLRAAILDGRLPAGEQLLPTRELASQYGESLVPPVLDKHSSPSRVSKAQLP
ncbi:hypothetical protein NUACC21_30370 [Scytonema sp. NUACC21]